MATHGALAFALQNPQGMRLLSSPLHPLCGLAVAATIGSSACTAAPEDVSITEARLRNLHEVVLPYYEQSGQAGSFIGVDGVKIAHHTFRHAGARSAIVFAPGRSEGSHSFMELFYDLRDQPYDIFVIDHRGQGASGRMLPDPLKGHVVKFQDYITDYDQFVRDVVHPERYDHVFGVAHSMGGAITLRYAAQHPETFDALVLSAPMLQIDMGPLTEETALSYASSVPADETVPLGGDGTTAPQFSGNYLTTNPAGFAVLNEVDNIYPTRRVGRATYNWLAESIRTNQDQRMHPELIKQPILLFQALNDNVVVPAAQTTFCAAATNCKLMPLANTRHELFYADDNVRANVLAEAFAFMGIVASNPAR